MTRATVPPALELNAAVVVTVVGVPDPPPVVPLGFIACIAAQPTSGLAGGGVMQLPVPASLPDAPPVPPPVVPPLPRAPATPAPPVPPPVAPPAPGPAAPPVPPPVAPATPDAPPVPAPEPPCPPCPSPPEVEHPTVTTAAAVNANMKKAAENGRPKVTRDPER